MRTLHVRQHHYQRRQRQNAIKCVAYNAFEGLHTPPTGASLFTPTHTHTLSERKGAKRKKCAALSNSKERGAAANSFVPLGENSTHSSKLPGTHTFFY